MISDWWAGLDAFFDPGIEIVVARTTEEAISALEMSDEERLRIARRARERTLEEHTAEHRARLLLSLLEDVAAVASEPMVEG